MTGEMDTRTDADILRRLHQYDFKFENIAFEGGGVKGIGHVGMVQVLRELGILRNLKRYAGTSAGSMIAAMAAVGCSPEEMLDAFNVNLGTTMLDAAFGVLSFLPNLIRRFGWNPGDRLLRHIDKVIENKTGITNITFRQIYENYGNELCILATNVTTMTVEYFHPKTTPDFPVSLAVKCSSALPGYMQPVKVDFGVGMTNLMVDGGLCCAFPVYVFDGWFLSMDKADSFFKKMGGQDTRFHGFNPKTLGALLIAATDNENNLGELLSRSRTPDRPNTKLARTNGKKTQETLEVLTKNQKIYQAGKNLFSSLQKSDEDDDAQITFHEFEEALKKVSQEDLTVLFGENYDPREAFHEMDRNADEKIQDSDFLHLMSRRGLRYQALDVGGTMLSITSLGDYVDNIIKIATNMSVVSNRQEHDIMRTIGINTDYVLTTDFDIDPMDTTFLIRQGRVATMDHLLWLAEKATNGQLPQLYSDIIVKKAASSADTSTSPPAHSAHALTTSADAPSADAPSADAPSADAPSADAPSADASNDNSTSPSTADIPTSPLPSDDTSAQQPITDDS